MVVPELTFERKKMKPLCIYHHNCMDGFTAAWVVKQKYPEAEFFPGIYNEQPPNVTGRDVIIVDFSYSPLLIVEMAKKANSILILDHHQSAMKDFDEAGVKNIARWEQIGVRIKFDMNHSGACLAWKHFFPNKSVPGLIQYVEDRDLWNFKLNWTKEIYAFMSSYEFTFENWDDFFDMCESSMIEQGKAIQRKVSKDIKELISVATRKMIIGGYKVPVSNIPYLIGSEACHISCQGEPFSAYYWDSPTKREFGLRSEQNGVDVSEIAKLYGGGGHKHAAGFRVSFEEARQFEI